MNGIIVRIISNLYSVKTTDGIHECRARGKFRKDEISPVVGDFVTIDPVNNYILEIKPRRNELKRPIIANVDACIIVSSLKRPTFSPFLLDKMISNVLLEDIEPIVVLSKYDLLDEDEKKEIQDIIDYYNKIGIKVIINSNVDEINKAIDRKTIVLTGQTGVGKSSLLNRLDINLNLETNDISDALGRGKHTTRHVEFFPYKNSLIADTPGFSALEIDKDRLDNIRYTFYEFKNDECKFRDCKHLKETGCAVLRDLENGLILPSRYESYRKMVEDEGSNFFSKK